MTDILFDVGQGVATVTLNRPDVLNAQNTAMRLDLVNAFSRLRADEATRVIVVTGAGERAFSAGADRCPAPPFGSVARK